MIKVTMAYGNYLNGESARGGAFGFKLEALIKAGEMKSLDGKETLLMLIVQDCERLYGKPLIDEEKMDSIEFCSKLPLS